MQRRNFLKITAGLGVAAFAAACSKQETAPIEQAATSAASSSAAEQHQREQDEHRASAAQQRGQRVQAGPAVAVRAHTPA